MDGKFMPSLASICSSIKRVYSFPKAMSALSICFNPSISGISSKPATKSFAHTGESMREKTKKKEKINSFNILNSSFLPMRTIIGGASALNDFFDSATGTRRVWAVRTFLSFLTVDIMLKLKIPHTAVRFSVVFKSRAAGGNRFS